MKERSNVWLLLLLLLLCTLCTTSQSFFVGPSSSFSSSITTTIIRSHEKRRASTLLINSNNQRSRVMVQMAIRLPWKKRKKNTSQTTTTTTTTIVDESLPSSSPPTVKRRDHQHENNDDDDDDDVHISSSSENNNNNNSSVSNNSNNNNNNNNKLESEFESMMSEFTHSYTDMDIISSIRDSRLRSLYYGIVAGANDKHVCYAFSILYQDFLPIRIAGRMVFRYLKQTMINAKHRQHIEDLRLSSEHGLTTEEIRYGRGTFMAIAADADPYHEEEKKDASSINTATAADVPTIPGTTTTTTSTSTSGGGLTVQQIIDSGIVETVVELSGYPNFDALVHAWDLDGNGKLNFEEFMLGLQNVAKTTTTTTTKTKQLKQETKKEQQKQQNVTTILDEVQRRIRPMEARTNRVTLSERKQRYEAKYESMLQTFSEWEQQTNPFDNHHNDDNNNNNNDAHHQNSRMMDVLRGCFAGAKNPKVVKALQIVYVDYSALRVGGDLVFNLMKTLMKRYTTSSSSL